MRKAHGIPIIADILMDKCIYSRVFLTSPKVTEEVMAGRMEIAMGYTNVAGKRSDTESVSVVYAV
jgi:hypothetical protein